MSKKKYNYLNHLILTAKKYEVEEYLFYEEKGRKLTAKQIELILLRNGIIATNEEEPYFRDFQVYDLDNWRHLNNLNHKH